MFKVRAIFILSVVLLILSCSGKSGEEEKLIHEAESAATSARQSAQTISDAPDLELPGEISPEKARSLGQVLITFCGALQSTCLSLSASCQQCKRNSPIKYCANTCSEAAGSCKAAKDCRRAFNRIL